jgi:hypothetical protein
VSKKPKQERFLMLICKDGLQVCDDLTRQRLRAKGYSMGDEVSATITKPRNPKFHRLAHVFGQMLADNLDEFEGVDCHTVLKRLQLEHGIACDEILLTTADGMKYVHRQARSLSFADMDEGQFHEVFRQMCHFVSKKYWPELTAEQIEEMAEVMVRAA